MNHAHMIVWMSQHVAMSYPFYYSELSPKDIARSDIIKS